MNRDRDSEIIHDLVTSKYKIAERNRLAKIKFLSNMSVDQMNDGSKRRDSEPSLAQTEKVDVRPVDLSVPGTPVSSHYLSSLRKLNKNPNEIDTDSDADDEDEDNANDKQGTFTSQLQEGLKQFTSDMEKLQREVTSHDSKKEEKNEAEVAVKKEPALSRVEQYFRESARRGSLTRDFTEVVQRFDPKLLHENGKSGLAAPGTPVSSKVIKAEKITSTKLGSFGDNIKKLEALKVPNVVKQADETLRDSEHVPPEKPKRINPVPLTPTITPPSPVEFETQPPPPPSVTTKINKKDFPSVSSKVESTDSSEQLNKKKFPPISSKNIASDKIVNKDFPPVSSKNIVIDSSVKNESTSFSLKSSSKVEATEVKSETAESASSESLPLVIIDKKDFPPVSSSKQPIEPLIEKKLFEVQETLIAIKENTKVQQPEVKKPLKRNDSNVSISSARSDISVPGTPVDSRRIFKGTTADDDDSDDVDSDMEIIDSSEVRALAQEFVVKIETLVQKTMDEEKTEDKNRKVEEKSLKIEADKQQGEHKLLIMYENSSNNKVKDYFEQSEKDKSYQRTFSEAENFNVPSLDVKEKVEKFFKESEEKKSLTRGFSEAVNYIEPVDIEKLFCPGTPVSSKTVECLKKEILGDEVIEEEKEIDPIKLKQMEAFQKARDALCKPPVEFKVNEYFEESKERHTLKRDFSEVYGEIGGAIEVQQSKEITNPNVQKFFEESEAQKTFRRQFSEAFQMLPPRINDILVDDKPEQQKSMRSESIFSAPPDCTDAAAGHAVAKKHGKKYGIDKYFATSLYRTAYQRSNADRRGSEPNHRLAILEDEYVFGETDALRSQVFQDDDQTPIHKVDAEGDFEQQNVQFWRDFLKPYTLNLPTDIVMRDELIDKYTKYTLE